MRLKPHLVLHKVGKSAQGKSEQPEFPVTAVEIEPHCGDNNKKEKCVGKYSTVTEDILKEEVPYRLIDNIREKRAYKQEPYIYMVCQGSEARRLIARRAILKRRGFSRRLLMLP